MTELREYETNGSLSSLNPQVLVLEKFQRLHLDSTKQICFIKLCIY